MTADHAETLSDSSVLTTPIPKPEQSSYVTAKVNPAPEPEPVLQAAALPLAPLAPGVLIGAPSLELELVRRLGQGAFSSVWLACDVKGQLGAFELSRKTSLLRSKSERRGRARKVDGLRPKTKLDEQNDGMKRVRKEWNGDASAVVVKESNAGRLVAVKMTERSMCEKNSRTRVSFVREVEVLRHISHPSIVSYLHSFSTPSHHCLVLEYVGGGELFDLIDNAETHARLDEPLLRRMFGELCRAVGWMHGVGLVHRDIKLENILLTTSPFTSPLPAAPLIKLSDFGLSRFIDPAQPMLTTLCGSESYAAPELVTGRPYDGRETDAWACGVVLYALATRRLPFDLPMANVAHREVVVGEARMREVERRERRALLMRIAKGEYSWPDDRASDCADEQSRETRLGWATGPALAHSAGIRRVVGRLLVRDPHKRSKIIDLWEDEWMHGEGAPLPPLSPVSPDLDHKPDETPDVAQTESPLDPDGDDQFLEADDDGVLVDSHDIVPGSVAHQEH
ncbi:kinase-like domain-containing protein [Sparassis latifolia]